MDTEWAPVLGNCRTEDDKLIFEGGVVDSQDRESPRIGNLISDKSFSGGRISVDVRFEEVDESTSAEVIIY